MTATTPHPPHQHPREGGWIGIDLGTSNCTAAVWDVSRSRCKVLRFCRDGRTIRGDDDDDDEGGTIVPSAVLFYRRRREEGEEYEEGVGTAVGRTALRCWDDATKNKNNGDDDHGDGSTALITSVKRIAGMTARQAREMREAHPEFWNALPFSPVILEDNGDDNGDDGDGDDNGGTANVDDMGTSDSVICDVLGGASDNYHHDNNNNNNNLDSHDASPCNDHDIHQPNLLREGVAIRVTPLSYDPLASSHETPHECHGQDDDNNNTILITPLQATAILLSSLRIAADDYLFSPSLVRRHGIRVPGAASPSSSSSMRIRNAVIGVPAHYSQSQRRALRLAARRAGFDGCVDVVTESTAAAMAYGLFVSTTITITTTSEKHASNEKRVLVFDMGGGTTDVTVAVLDGPRDDDDDNDTNQDDDFGDRVRFRVAATAGDSRLGGDDVDECLARYVWERHLRGTSCNDDDDEYDDKEWNSSHHLELIRKCRRAKEELCGNGTDDDDDNNDGEADGSGVGKSSSEITIQGRDIRITRDEFDAAIRPLVDRAERVVDDALSSLPPPPSSDEPRTPAPARAPIHEVVLVGGSTRIPPLRSMLRRKFPPPVPPDLCTSVSAETAVAQGLAIQAAWLSGAVPLWELRNAMMLDALPHSIGVWVIHPRVDGGGGDENNNHHQTGPPFQKGDFIEPKTNPEHRGHFVPILAKNAPLPAAGNASFALANLDQPGVTVVAAERIGPGEVYQCMEVFHFLLHRLDDNDEMIKTAALDARYVEVGMTLETSGKFVVSIFDEHDPEHRERRRRYRKEKGVEEEKEEDGRWNEFYREEEDDGRVSFSGTEIGLVVICAVLFALYVGARIAFSDLEMEPHENDEL